LFSNLSSAVKGHVEFWGPLTRKEKRLIRRTLRLIYDSNTKVLYANFLSIFPNMLFCQLKNNEKFVDGLL